jgi:hypothetical protein
VWSTGTGVKDARFEDKNTARELVILGDIMVSTCVMDEQKMGLLYLNNKINIWNK